MIGNFFNVAITVAMLVTVAIRRGNPESCPQTITISGGEECHVIAAYSVRRRGIICVVASGWCVRQGVGNVRVTLVSYCVDIVVGLSKNKFCCCVIVMCAGKRQIVDRNCVA